MRSLLLNTFDISGGAALATFRLHKGLLSEGVESKLLVQYKQSDDPNVLGPSTKFKSILARSRPYLDNLILRKYKKRENQLFSASILPDFNSSIISEIDPDIVHLFWITGGFLRLETLKNVNRPIIWTLHDMWPFTGGCHYDNECGKYTESCGSCPILGSKNNSDLSFKVLRRKKKSYPVENITVVATSDWIGDCARKSSLFRNCRIEVIPNGIDSQKYKPVDKNVARYTYNLPLDKKLILFSAFSSTSDKRKGFDYLLSAMQKMSNDELAKNVELVILGSSEPECQLDVNMKIHYIPYLHDDISQIILYSAADITILPSRQENLSNTVIESLLCATPVIAFDIGGMPDMIKHKYNGYLAKSYDSGDIYEGIKWILGDRERFQLLSEQARKSAVDNYSIEKITSQYIDLYQDVVK